MFIGTDAGCFEKWIEFHNENGRDLNGVKFPSSYCIADELDRFNKSSSCIHNYI